MFKFATAAAIAISSVQAELKPGACPVRSQNKPEATFTPYSMAGLWYEYVWQPEYQQEYGYQCSTWIVLSDEAEAGPGQYVVYNNMVFAPESDENGELSESEAKFIKFGMKWDEPTEAGQKALARFKRHDDDMEGVADAELLNMQIIDTDYHNYAVGSTCHEEDGQHEENFFMWSREKQPSMYMRRRARNALLEVGVEPETMVKGPLVACWGKDILM